MSFENWAWLVNRKWLPENGLAATKVARWADLVTSTDGVDVYHVQMLVFSLVVGMSLFKNGVTATDLSSFEIPESMLILLGLSQAVYVGGKVVASPTILDLNKALEKLRGLETAFIEAALKPADKDADKPAEPSTPQSPSLIPTATPPPKDLGEAKVRAEEEYSSSTEQCNLVRIMFKSVLGDFQKELHPNFRPRFP